MTTSFFDRKKVWSKAQLVLFILGFAISCIPIFSMSFLITLDGPNHLYSGDIFYKLFSNDSFYHNYLELNPDFTPNYFTVIILGGLQQFFSSPVALKIFHTLHITLLFLSAFYWTNSNKENKVVYPFLVMPFAFSYLFFSGFYNFIFAVSLSFFVLGYFDRIKEKKKSIIQFTVLGLLLFATYLTHVIPFFFAGIYLAINQLILLQSSNWKKQEFIQALYLLISCLPGLLLTFIFMESKNIEYGWLDTSVLIEKLTSGSSIVIKHQDNAELNYINWIKLFALAGTLMLFIYYAITEKKSLGLWISSTIILCLYFFLPDSAGFASVFSVRIEYIFWLFVVIGASRLTLKNFYFSVFTAITGLGLLIFQVNANLPYWQTLNGHAKSISSATEHIEDQSVVYPIFNSLYWDDFHISNLAGTQNKEIMILENTSARQDYFPIIYKAPYENCLKEQQDDLMTCNNQTIKIDYLLVIGRYKLDPNDKLATSLYSKAFYDGEVIYEDDFVQLLKLPTLQN